jgi:hypothetical protein
MNRVASPSVQQTVFKKYGILGARTEDFEVDYLITPELGGADDIKNLWPEPYASTDWGAHVKDALEDRLHHMVCEGKIDLGTAQREMADDWISAYKKYFHTDKPLFIDSARGSPVQQEIFQEHRIGNTSENDYEIDYHCPGIGWRRQYPKSLARATHNHDVGRTCEG